MSTDRSRQRPQRRGRLRASDIGVIPSSSFKAFVIVTIAFVLVALFTGGMSEKAADAFTQMAGGTRVQLPAGASDRWTGYPERCPETTLPLALARLETVEQLDERVRQTGLTDLGGRPVKDWPDVLIRIDGKRLYPARLTGALRREDGVDWSPKPLVDEEN